MQVFPPSNSVFVNFLKNIIQHYPVKMRCLVPEISWHNRDPVYTVDVQRKTDSKEDFYRLASGGADCHVVIWYVTVKGPDEEDPASIEFAADLHRHIRGVNVVRFAPSGELLASGDDDAVIIIWRLRQDIDFPEPATSEEKEKESWVSVKVLKGHLEDIYDLAWSSDSNMLFTGSVDNTAILWDASKGKKLGFVGEHKGFVQGVAWDPQDKFLATMCTDRSLRIFNSQTKKTIMRVTKGKMNSNNNCTDKEKEDKGTKLFHDDSVKTFFRRLTFSPGGELLVTPCGVLEDASVEGKPQDVTYVFLRGAFARPALHLPSPSHYTVAVRFCPLKFRLREGTPSLFALPHRYVFAVATRSSVVLYDTQQAQPFGFVSNIHYTGLTDITWSSDGRLIVVSSSEGYCSVITFQEGEIGVPCDAEGTTQPAEAKQGSPVHAEGNENSCEVIEIKEKKDEEAMVVVEEKEEKEEKEEPRAGSDEAAERVFKTPKKVPIGFGTPKKGAKSPADAAASSPSQWSLSSQLSLCIDGDEDDLMSEVEQARRLRASPAGALTPSKSAPSPTTPGKSRRVELIQLSSPKSPKTTSTRRKLIG